MFGIYSKHAIFTDLPGPVDYQFFGIPKEDAKWMDPSQRNLLQHGWRALCDAGQTRERLRGMPVGVYSGSMNLDFGFDVTGILDHGNIGMLGNRLSYVLGLTGPTCFIDTGCSSSMVTADMAAYHVRRGKTMMSVGMGVNQLLSPTMFLVRCQGSMISHIGRSQSFHTNADGYCVSEGAGAVVVGWESKLKPDTIIWRASEIMQDGRSAQITAPSGPPERVAEERDEAGQRQAGRDLLHRSAVQRLAAGRPH
jgi:acyl transferase domain-containing protein